jgi:hypothetical protein
MGVAKVGTAKVGGTVGGRWEFVLAGPNIPLIEDATRSLESESIRFE